MNVKSFLKNLWFAVASIVAVVLGGVQIFDYISRSGEVLKVDVYPMAFKAPHNYKDFLSNTEPSEIKRIIQEDKVINDLIDTYKNIKDKSSKTSDSIEKYLDALSKHLHSLFRNTMENISYSDLRGFVVIELKNVGKKPLKEVLIHVKSAKLFAKSTGSYQDELINLPSKNGDANISTIPQNSSITIYAWTRDGHYHEKWGFKEDDFRFSHSEGIGDIEFYAPLHNSFLRFLEKYGYIIFLSVLIPFGGFIGYVLAGGLHDMFKDSGE